MLLITFGRAASQELRERVRDQLVEAAARARRPRPRPATTSCSRTWSRAATTSSPQRRHRLRDALAGFDAATIATTHQFCQLVLRSLGVAGDTDAGVTLVESLDELVAEVVDDLYLRSFGAPEGHPGPHPRAGARARPRGRRATRTPLLTPVEPAAGHDRGGPRRLRRRRCWRELERRKRRLGILGYDDLLSRLAAALEDADAPGPRTGCAGAGRIVMVDEFQDTDPVQWEVIERAFVGHATAGAHRRPQAGDLRVPRRRHRDLPPGGREGRPAVRTLGTNWRSDEPLVDSASRRCSRGAALGHEDIVVREVEARQQDPPAGRRPAQRPVPAAGGHPREVRAQRHQDHRDGRGPRPHRRATSPPTSARCSPATRRTTAARSRAGDVAVIVEAHRDARACRDALAAAGRPGRLHRRHRRLRVAGRHRLAVPARGVRAAAPQRPGPGGRDHDVLRRDRGQPRGRRRRSSPTGSAETLRELGRPRRGSAGSPRCSRPPRSPGWPSGCSAGAAASGDMTDLAHLAQLLHETRPPRAARAAGAARLAARPVRGAGRRGRAQPAARQRRRGGPDHDRVGEQGPAVPPRLPAVRLQPPRPRRRASCSTTRTAARCLDIGGTGAAGLQARSRPGAARRWPATTSGSPTSR